MSLLDQTTDLRLQEAGYRQPKPVRESATPEAKQDAANMKAAQQIVTDTTKLNAKAADPFAEPPEVGMARKYKNKIGEVEGFRKKELEDFDKNEGRWIAEKPDKETGLGGELLGLEAAQVAAEERVGTLKGAFTSAVAGEPTQNALKARQMLDDTLKQVQARDPSVQTVADLANYREALKQKRSRITENLAGITQRKTQAELEYGRRMAAIYGPPDVEGIDPVTQPKAAVEAALKTAVVTPVAGEKPVEKDTSFLSAFKSGMAAPAKGVGTSIDVAGELVGSQTLQTIGEGLESFGTDPQNYESASGQFAQTFNPKYIPRAVVEQVGQLAGSILSRVVGSAIGASAGGALGSAVPVAGTTAGAVTGGAAGAFIGPAVFEAAQLVGPVARERAKNEGRTEITKEDLAYALGTAAASGSLNSIGAKYLPGGSAATGTFVKRLIGAIASEGITEGTQSLVQQTGESVATEAGLQISPQQALAEGVIGAATGGAASTVGAVVPSRGAPVVAQPPAAEQVGATAPLPTAPVAPVAEEDFAPAVDDELAAELANQSQVGMVETPAAQPASAPATSAPITPSVPVETAQPSTGLDSLSAGQTAPSVAEAITQEPAGEAGSAPNQVSGETPSGTKTEQAPAPVSALTPEAEALIRKIDTGGAAPAFISKNLEKIANDNGVTVTRQMTPNDVIDAIRAKRQPAPAVATPNAEKAGVEAKGIKAGESPAGRLISSPEAQQAEQLSPKEPVAGSIPAGAASLTETDDAREQRVKSTPPAQRTDADIQFANERARARATPAAPVAVKPDEEVESYLASTALPALAKGKVKSVLSKKVALRSTARNKIYQGTRAEVIPQMLADGYKPKAKQVPVVAEVRRLAYNRMDQREQDAYEKRRREAGTKTEYSMEDADGSSFVVTKPEHDLAVYIQGAAQADTPTQPLTQPTAATSDKPQEQTPTPAPAPSAGQVSPTVKKSFSVARIVARGANTPAEFVRSVAKATKLKASDPAAKVLMDFAPRLARLAPTEFAQMEVNALTGEQWAASPETSRMTPDSAAAYDPTTNTLYLNTDKLKTAEDIVSAVVHESGHFAERFGLGTDFTQAQWESLTDGQREAAARQYDENNVDLGEDLKNDPRARAEWVAMQFARVVRGDTEGMNPQLKGRLTKFLTAIREFVNKWLGNARLSTAELDARIIAAMFPEGVELTTVTEAAPVTVVNPAASPEPRATPKTEPSGVTTPRVVSEPSDPIIGRTWNSPFGKQTIRNRVNDGGTIDITRPSYEAIDEKGGVRRYDAAGLEETIKQQEYQTTPEYAAKREQAKEAQRLRDEAQARRDEAKREQVSQIEAFTKDDKPLVAGKKREALLKEFNFDGKAMTRKAKVEELVAAGEKPSTQEVDVIQPLTRTQFNRADQRQQEAHQRKVDAGGKKTVYYVGGYDMGKIGYDYAQFLFNKESVLATPKVAPATEKVATPTKPVFEGNLEAGQITDFDMEVVGNFKTKKEADAVAGKDYIVSPYLNGKYVRGWLVLKETPAFIANREANIVRMQEEAKAARAEEKRKQAERDAENRKRDAIPIPKTEGAKSFKDTQAELLTQIDAAIEKAPTEEAYADTIKADVSKRIASFKSGTSTIRVTNTKEVLTRLREQVAKRIGATPDAAGRATSLPKLTYTERDQIREAKKQGKLEDPMIRSLLDRATAGELEKLGVSGDYTKVAPGVVMPKDAAARLADLKAGKQGEFDVLGSPGDNIQQEVARLSKEYPEQIEPAAVLEDGGRTLKFTHKGKPLTIEFNEAGNGFIGRVEDNDGNYIEEDYERDNERNEIGGSRGIIDESGADQIGEDYYESIPASAWKLEPTTLDDSNEFYAVEINDGEGRWEEVSKSLSLAEALSEYNKTGGDNKRLAYYTGGETRVREYGAWTTKSEVKTVKQPSFVDKLMDEFPAMDRATARQIAANRNPENQDPYMVAQAWARHNLTNYDDKLGEMRDVGGANDAERAKARFDIRGEIDSILAKWKGESHAGPLGTPADKPLTPPKNAEVGGEAGKRYRSHTDTLIQRGYDAVRTVYDTKSNASTKQAADAFLSAAGEAVAAAEIFNATSQLAGPVRVAVGLEIERRLYARTLDAALTPEQQAEAKAQFNRLSNRLAQIGTESGQTSQAFDMVDRIFSEEGAIHSATQQVKNRQDRMLGEEGQKTEKEIVTAMNNENRKVLEDLLKDVKADVKKVKVTKGMVEDYLRNLEETSPDSIAVVALIKAMENNPADRAQAIRDFIGETRKTLWRQYRDAIANAAERAAEGPGKKKSKALLQVFSADIQKIITDALPKADAKGVPFSAQDMANRINDILAQPGRFKDALDAAKKQIAESKIDDAKKQAALDALASLTAGKNIVGDMLNKIVKSVFDDMDLTPKKAAQMGNVKSDEIAAEVSKRVAALFSGDVAKQMSGEVSGIVGNMLTDARNQIREQLTSAEIKKQFLTAEEVKQADTLLATGTAEEIAAFLGTKKSPQENERIAALQKELSAKKKQLGEVLRKKLGQMSKADLDKAIKGAFSEVGAKINDILRLHIGEVDAIGSSLTEKLIQQANLTPSQANELANAVRKRLADLTTDAKRKVLQKLSKDKGGISRRMFTIIDKIVEMSNAGALDQPALRNRIAEELKLPRVTDTLAKRLKELTDKRLLTPEGFQRDRVDTDILTELRKVEGVGKIDIATAIYYSHILSGYTTQLVNIISTAMNTTADVTIAAVLAEADALLGRSGAKVGTPTAQAIAGLIAGARMGVAQARATLDTGYANKAFGEKLPDVSPIMEIVSKEPATGAGKALKGYATLLRYITRSMKAADAVFYRSASEAFQRVAAAKIAGAAEGGNLSRAEINSRVRDLLKLSPAEFEQARKQARDEGLNGYDYDLRVGEIIQQKRGEALTEKSDRFALESTFNNTPRGALGVMAESVGNAAKKIPALKLFVPFTNIVANVTNASLNYSPLGFARAAKGYLGESKLTDAERVKKGIPTRAEERATLNAKAFAGTAAMVGLLSYAMAGDDDEPPFITANGPKDNDRRNQLRQSGWKPHSIKIGDTYVSYLSSPMAVPLAFVGNWADGMKYNDLGKGDTLSNATQAFVGIGSTITEMSFLSGVADLFDTLRGKPGASPEKWAANVATSAAIPNLVRQLDRTFDPTLYKGEGVSGALASGIPGLRQQLPERLTPTANTIESQPAGRFGGMATNDPLWDTLNQKGAVISSMHSAKVNNRQATPQEIDAIIRDSGPAIERRLRNSLTAIQRMDNETAEKFVQSVAREERARSRDRLPVLMRNSTARFNPFAN